MADRPCCRTDFTPGFKLDLFWKDMNLVQQTGRKMGVPLMGSGGVVPLMDTLIAQGQGGRFSSGVGAV
ncbi:NAD-binding protein [Romeriopsis navalis]|uniref:NAD-binding protein n=1 Tax=Romeriopsis navalis TaxID=2992132 RepID=UPI0021F88146|nr:NAD-binding protein [Romeriopsis navalis]